VLSRNLGQSTDQNKINYVFEFTYFKEEYSLAIFSAYYRPIGHITGALSLKMHTSFRPSC
jgi:hypothetical protein